MPVRNLKMFQKQPPESSKYVCVVHDEIISSMRSRMNRIEAAVWVILLEISVKMFLR